MRTIYKNADGEAIDHAALDDSEGNDMNHNDNKVFAELVIRFRSGGERTVAVCLSRVENRQLVLSWTSINDDNTEEQNDEPQS